MKDWNQTFAPGERLHIGPHHWAQNRRQSLTQVPEPSETMSLKYCLGMCVMSFSGGRNHSFTSSLMIKKADDSHFVLRQQNFYPEAVSRPC